LPADGFGRFHGPDLGVAVFAPLPHRGDLVADLVVGGAGAQQRLEVVAGLREKGKARRKEQIIEAAKRLLASGGLEALSLRRLADEAELSVRTLYSLVGSKEQVLEAVMQQNHDRVLADLLDTDEKHPVEKLIAFVDSTYRIIAEDAAAQKPLMRVLMTFYYEGRLSPHRALTHDAPVVNPVAGDCRIRASVCGP